MKDKSSGGLAPFTNNYEVEYGGRKGKIPNADFGTAGANVKESRHNGTGDSKYKTRGARKGAFGGKR
jgi:hypothetical protein